MSFIEFQRVCTSRLTLWGLSTSCSRQIAFPPLRQGYNAVDVQVLPPVNICVNCVGRSETTSLPCTGSLQRVIVPVAPAILLPFGASRSLQKSRHPRKGLQAFVTLLTHRRSGQRQDHWAKMCQLYVNMNSKMDSHLEGTLAHDRRRRHHFPHSPWPERVSRVSYGRVM